MFKRNDNRNDALQRQLGALRQQLGPNPDDPGQEREAEDMAFTPDRDEIPNAAPAETNDANPRNSESYGFGTSPMYESGYGQRGEQEFRDPMSTPAMPSSPVPQSDDQINAQISVVAHDTVWKGDVTSEGSIHVHGRVEGTITAKADVFVAEDADIDATITAANVVIAGRVKGTIRCGSRFEVLPQGRVDGEIQSPSLVVHEGAAIVGQFRMGAGEGTETAKPAIAQRRPTRGTA